MLEFILLIRNKGDHETTQTTQEHRRFLLDCESSLGRLKRGGRLIAAQPLSRRGVLLSRRSGDWSETPLALWGEIQVGYYHLHANDLAEATSIAKHYPESSCGRGRVDRGSPDHAGGKT